MSRTEDFLLEIHTEELPAKLLLPLANTLAEVIKINLENAQLSFSKITFYATPRRLALLITGLEKSQPDQIIERKGPAKKAAFDADGKPSKACLGFLKSAQASESELMIISNDQGEWVGLKQHVPGQSVMELMPTFVERALVSLPSSKRMRWGDGKFSFVRPILSIVMLYGKEVIAAPALSTKIDHIPIGRTTYGHHFMAPQAIELKNAKDYLEKLEEAYVFADFFGRRELIKLAAEKVLLDELGLEAALVCHQTLLEEVTGLVEWPVVLLGKFDAHFSQLPEEILISAMQDHQRYFPVRNTRSQKLLPYFICVSNIESQEPRRVIKGNERVLRARLADAAFFYQADQKESLEKRLERLKGRVFQAKLGTLYDKAKRISQLAAHISECWQENKEKALRAGWLAKADLTTQMVSEFPELQGVMGYYYALSDGESVEVAEALKEQYLPRFAGDELPKTKLNQALALADRIDTLVGIFSIQQMPTGDKDPFALRRAALGIVRILIEKENKLDLKKILSLSLEQYSLSDSKTIELVFHFILDRLRAWYLEQGISADVLAAVMTLELQDLLDIHARIQAVQNFKQLNEAQTLSMANKRVSNILTKYEDHIEAKTIDSTYFEHEAEKELAHQLEMKGKIVERLSEQGQYNEVLIQLADLHKPLDHFFDQVMVMTEDKKRRENRLLLLNQLRNLFLKVADIALLQ